MSAEITVSDRLELEKIKLLYNQTATVLVGATIVSLAAAYVLWDEASHLALIIWLGATFALIAVRLVVHMVYRRRVALQTPVDYKRWGVFYSICAFGTGTLWGLCFALFFPANPITLAVLFIIHAGYISAAILATSTYLPAYACFVITGSVIPALATLYHGSADQMLLAPLSILYTAILFTFAFKQNRMITEQIELRMQNADLLESVRAEKDRAEQAVLAKNRFLASASHDLRQPVHALGLFIGSLESHLTTDKARSLLEKIKRSADALSGLFHGLLDISKLDAGVVESNPRHFRIGTLLARLEPDFRELARRKGLKLYIPTDDPSIAFVDSALLERVLRNLLSNAIKYTEFGAVTVDVDNNPQRRQLQLAVSDTGQGIPQTEHENIFSEYHQLENPQRDRDKGLGLGLAIVKRTCDLMEIPIQVSSSPGDGSTFTLTIPAGIAELPVAPVQAIAPAEEESGESRTVLIVDDELDILEGMQEMLLGWGCRVISADSTQNALDCVGNISHLDAIIADFRLPNNDSGIETIQQVRNHLQSDIPALLITGDTDPQRLQEARAAGIRMIHKPVETNRFRKEFQTLTEPAPETAELA